MEKKSLIEQIKASIKAKGVTYADLAEAIGASEVWTVHALLRQATFSEQDANKIGSMLNLSPEIIEELKTIPLKGHQESGYPLDPTLYRLQEMMQSFGPSIKLLINEKFGDGAMSGISFNMDVERLESADGPRVKLTMTGKYLPFNKF
ncbi:cyanase [Pedobacter frigidisoli]|uniref:cyanase n=1 Tax=Pedobacter frigidisoli TaxID=2530455 RepID=UPI002931913F|nr:cyanase [Pedobacter frigidisoli]